MVNTTFSFDIITIFSIPRHEIIVLILIFSYPSYHHAVNISHYQTPLISDLKTRLSSVIHKTIIYKIISLDMS